jgi:hypothetical protein
VRPYAQFWMAVVGACVLAGSVGLSSAFAGSSTSSTASRSTATTRTMIFPYVGAVVIRSDIKLGLVIVDQETSGNRFYLRSEQAGECLSYVRANPAPSASDFSAACPGVAIAKKRLARRR